MTGERETNDTWLGRSACYSKSYDGHDRLVEKLSVNTTQKELKSNKFHSPRNYEVKICNFGAKEGLDF